jgi:hypothetical protein
MSRVIFVCDGCGKQEDGWFTINGTAAKPEGWYGRRDDDGTQIACSRECIDAVAAKSGKTRVVLPI